MFDKEVGQYLNINKERLEHDIESVLLKKRVDNKLKKRMEILNTDIIKLQKDLNNKFLFLKFKGSV